MRAGPSEYLLADEGRLEALGFFTLRREQPRPQLCIVHYDPQHIREECRIRSINRQRTATRIGDGTRRPCDDR